MEKQIKIAKTYRLLPETIEDIKKIKDSFRKQRYEFSSDAAVIQYSVGIAKDFVERVDDDQLHLHLKKEEVQMLLNWFKTSTQETSEEFQEALKLKDKLTFYIETSP